MKSRPRVSFYTNIIPPYRLALFNLLSENVELEVHTAAQDEAHRGWTDFSSLRTFELFRHNLPKIRIKESFFYFPRPTWLKNRKCDLLIIGGWEHPANLFLILLSFTRRQNIYIFFESTEHDSSFSKYILIRTIKKEIFSRAKGVITTGQASSQNVRNMGVSDEKIHQGFNAIDSEWWSKENKRRKKTSLRTGTRYIYVGQLIQRKRVDLLIECFSKVSRNDDSLLIVGDGPLEPYLRSLSHLATSRGVIEFRNSVDSETLRNLYLEHDLLVLPSEFEVWGMVALEALACELGVIISSHCGVTPEIKDLSNVLVFSNKEELEVSLMRAKNLKSDQSLPNFFLKNSISALSNLIFSLSKQECRFIE